KVTAKKKPAKSSADTGKQMTAQLAKLQQELKAVKAAIQQAVAREKQALQALNQKKATVAKKPAAKKKQAKKKKAK
ncbi:MAG: hypothetical protein OEY87_10325, partial [Gammaproteobacteria bacterium]|nr:hypothetical protein [Gammaproteobacteria bacterium]